MAKKRKTAYPGTEELTQIRVRIEEGLADREVADEFNRTVACIRKIRDLKDSIKGENRTENKILKELHESYLWLPVKKALNTHEIKYFEKCWLEMIGQFSDQGILPSDKLLIKDFILYEININRLLARKKIIEDDMAVIKDDITRERARDEEDRDNYLLQSLNRELASNTQSLKTISDESKILQERKEKLQSQLRMDRRDRFKNAEESKISFLDKIKELDTASNRRKEGRLNALAILAMNAEKLRLSEEMVYSDGSIDRPYLASDTLSLIDNAEKEDENAVPE